MDFEPNPPSTPNRIRTPESVQECLVLSKHLDDQIAEWVQEARSRHPALDHTLAAHIVKGCTAPDQSEIDETQKTLFERGLTPKEARTKDRRFARRAALAPYAQSESFDDHQSIHKDYEIFFSRIGALSDNPGVQPAYGTSIEYLHRLLILREQLALQNEAVPNYNPFDFAVILNRIHEDLF